MGLETRQLDSVQGAPPVSEEGRKKAPQSGTDSDLLWTTAGGNAQRDLEKWGRVWHQKQPFLNCLVAFLFYIKNELPLLQKPGAQKQCRHCI